MSAVEQLPDLTRDHRDFLWERGWPTHLLYSHQQDVIRRLYFGDLADLHEVVFQWGRRSGKTGVLTWDAHTFCSRNPGVVVVYLAPTAKQLRAIVEPHLRRYIGDMPEAMRPEYRRHEGEIRYPNGSILYLAGCERGSEERLRGMEVHRWYVDEGAFVVGLEYLVNDILVPMSLTTDAVGVISSTPPKQPAHEFARVYCANAEREGRLVHMTVHDATHLNPETIARLCKTNGGEDSITWRREYLAELVFDTEAAIVPEFVKLEPQIVEERKRPTHCKKYVVGDIGFVDLSAWLFCYVDFEHALLVVEDEMQFTGKAASDQASELRRREVALWGEPANDNAKPQRYVDATDLVRVEFPKGEPGYNVGPVNNQDLDATVNGLRRATQERRYRIHPRCRQLIAHMKMGTWNKRRTEFERVEGYGHFDGIAALMYLVKSASVRTNPFPSVPPEATREDWAIPAQRPGTGAPGLAQLKRGAKR
jgi:hypothetical protein